MENTLTWDKTTKRRLSRRLKALKPFDPYHSALCTCGPKLTLNVYNGCGYECFYCYTSSYSRGRWGRASGTWSVRPQIIQNLTKDLATLKAAEGSALAALRTLPVVVSLSSDPYPDAPQASEVQLGATRQCLQLLTEAGMAVLIQTKSDLVCRDLEVLDARRTVIGITVTTLDEQLAARMEPYCPMPRRRIQALAQAAARGFATLCRIDPIVPLVNDDEAGLEALVRRLADAGVRHIVSSTFKKRADSARRFAYLFPEAERASRSWYESIPVSGYYYLAAERRRAILERLAHLVARHCLTFATCREGLELLNTARCDGQHFLELDKQ